MSSSSFYSDSGVTTADADAVESSKNAAAQSAQDAQTHANTASTKASEASDSAIAAAASASTANNSNVQAVASNLGGTNTIGTVAGNIADINTVAGMESNVDTVANASYKAKVETVANAAYKSDVETVADSSYKSDVETVADTAYKAKVETVADSTYKTAVEEVAADLTGSNLIGDARTNADRAAVSAGSALNSENNAASSESTAATHASNASTHATTASGHADDAEDAKTAAQAARDAAQGHRTQTGQDAAAAAASANSASSSASDAASSEANAAADALVASNSADSAKIDANVVKNISANYGTLNAAINSASSSATQAASSASTASTHATTASGHASTAATHAANLGSVAYQNLTAIAESKSRNAADVFVYDTSKDSDGGAWRNRTQGKSWYNEALNTSYRGATKEFPAVAVIVAHNGAGNDGGVDIHDATDPTCPLWMRFQGDYSWGNGKMMLVAGRTGNAEITSVTMKDAKLFVGSSDQSSSACGLHEIDFITERCKFRKAPSSSSYNVPTNHVNIAARNADVGIDPSTTMNYEGLVSSFINDIAVTVLPNAPIDPDTVLPVPTIAVATDGGVSVIKDDGSVVNITGQISNVKIVAWKGNKLVTNGVYGDAIAIYEIPSADQGHSPREAYYVWQDHSAFFKGSTYDAKDIKDDETIVVGCAKGLQQIHHTDGDDQASLINRTTHDYNTGWLHGDIKLATLMDTTAENISAPELVTNGDFSSFGSDLVSNGDFSNGTTGWSTNQTTEALQVVNGKLRVTEDGVADPNVARAWQMITTEIGKTYKVTADIDPANTTTCALNISNSVSTSQSINVQTSGTATTAEFYFIAESTSTYVLLTVNSANTVGSYADFDNVTVKEITGWKAPVANSEVTLSNGQLTFMSGQASNSYVNQDLSGGGANPLVVGKTYAVSFNLISEVGTGLPYVRLGGDDVASIGSYGIGQNTIYFKYDGVSADLRFMTYAQDNVGFTIDNVSVTEVVADRSVNNNGLNIVGNVTKSAVATGAELVSYEGGSGVYLEQPYNADLNFGYGDYCVMFWAKQISGDLTAVFRGDITAGNTGGTGAMHIWLNGGKLKTIIDENSQQIDTPKGNASFAHYVVTRRNGTVYFYQDGVLFHTYDAATKNVSRTEGTRVLSGYYPHNNTANKLALLRISATAPTPEQIAKIYRDEKPLFQEGAMCTLYGNSSDINGISYDDDTGITYAGTSNHLGTGGLSEFTGLQRTGLNSNTTSVGAAVSAQNGLVVSE